MTVSNVQLTQGQTSVAASNLFTAGDPDGDTITQYAVFDASGSGHFQVGNTVEPAAFFISPVQYGQAVFIPGTSVASDHIYVAAYDGFQWSAVKDFYVSTPAQVGAGATLELTSAYSGIVSFAGATGTLKIDNSSSFTGTIAGQLAIGDVIDLADISAGANATISYSGNNSPGTLTVTDGTHKAQIALLGNYSPANFTASSDSHGGTSIVDPPILSPAFTPRASVSIAPITTLGDAQLATVSAVAAAPIEPLSESTVASRLASTPVAPPTSPAGLESAATVGGMGSLSGNSVIFLQSPGRSRTQAVETHENVFPDARSPQTAIAREIVSPDDVILAIREGDIALKSENSASLSSERSPWLFDEDRGTFEAPPPESLTIFVDGDDGDRLAQTGNFSPAQAFPGEAVVVPDQSWFGVFRKVWMQPARGMWWR